MNRGSAIVSILIAFVAGLAIGNLTGSGSDGDHEEHAGAEVTGETVLGAAAAEKGKAAAGDVERYRVPVDTKLQPSKGPADALVTIVEVSDFQCPFCSRVGGTLAQIQKEYGDKVRVVWRNNPLPFHKQAGPAHNLAMEAFAQGGSKKFWEAHDLLFANQKALQRADLDKYATQLGLDAAKVKQALDTNKHDAAIKADQATAAKFGATGTPAFFINGRFLSGAQPFPSFKAIIDDEVKRAEQLIKGGTKKGQVYAALTAGAKTEKAKAAPQQQQARRQPDPKAVYKVPVDLKKQPSKGPADALVTIVEVSDFQCPFCSRVNPTMKQIQDEYGKDVRILWRNNPLPFHKQAGPAANLAMEAFTQGGSKKFWEAHDLIFANQKALERADLEKYAKQLGLDLGKVKSALDSGKYDAQIKADQDLAASLGARGTPSFFINGRNLRGAQPFQAFKAVIDEELAKAKALVAKGTPRNQVYDELTKNAATAQKFIEAPGGAPGAAPKPSVYNIPLPAKAPSKGGKNAKVVIQEFSDFQCPFCSRVNPTIKQIIDEYGDKVKILWRNYPLPFHKEAPLAAEASLEAFAQGGDAKFWAYHDKLFANQRAITRPDLEKYATELGLDLAKFKAALDNHTHKASVDADMAAVTKAGARIGTPSFFINGELLQGAQPFPAFKAAIDKALAK